MALMSDLISMSQFGNPRGTTKAIESVIAPLSRDSRVISIGLHFDPDDPSQAVITAKCEDPKTAHRVGEHVSEQVPKALASAGIEATAKEPKVFVSADRLEERS